MENMTRKEFAKELKGTAFIVAVWNIELKEVIKEVKEAKEIPVIYTVTDVLVRSKDWVMITGDGTKSYRDLAGKNTFYKDQNLLIHINCVDEENFVVMINLKGVTL